jgi:hypothetical protein
MPMQGMTLSCSMSAAKGSPIFGTQYHAMQRSAASVRNVHADAEKRGPFQGARAGLPG